MKATPQHRTVREILDLRRNKLLEVDPEYQRGHVWTKKSSGLKPGQKAPASGQYCGRLAPAGGKSREVDGLERRIPPSDHEKGLDVQDRRPAQEQVGSRLMGMRITGLRELERKLKRLQRNVRAIDGKNEVPVTEMLPPAFMWPYRGS